MESCQNAREAFLKCVRESKCMTEDKHTFPECYELMKQEHGSIHKNCYALANTMYYCRRSQVKVFFKKLILMINNKLLFSLIKDFVLEVEIEIFYLKKCKIKFLNWILNKNKTLFNTNLLKKYIWSSKKNYFTSTRQIQ